jgi:hypothetical protein
LAFNARSTGFHPLTYFTSVLLLYNIFDSNVAKLE